MAQKKIAVIGSGWGGYLFSKYVNKSLYDVTVISPRNHFIFTPMLPAAAVGTLEFNCIQENVRNIKNVDYLQAKAQKLDPFNQTISCTDAFKGNEFDVNYDYMVLAAGSRANTFNTPGVVYGQNNCYFLKELSHARAIRARVIECVERACFPSTSEEEKRRLLSFVIVGAGPINVEFAGELYDFLQKDVGKLYPELKTYIKVHIIEASQHVLGPYSPQLQEYAENLIVKRDFNLKLGVAVKEVRQGEVELADGEIIPSGIVIWSTGVQPVPFVNSLKQQPEEFAFQKGRLLVDNNFRLLRPCDKDLYPHHNIFAIGDCAISIDIPLPQLGYVAKKQASHLAANFNKKRQEVTENPFKFTSMLQMTQVGGGEAIIDTSPGPAKGTGTQTGWKAALIWKAAYWGMQVSTVNKILIPMYWLKAKVFGRDTSRF